MNEVILIHKVDDYNGILLQNGYQSISNSMSKLKEWKQVGKYFMYDGKLVTKHGNYGDNIPVITKSVVKDVLEYEIYMCRQVCGC